MNTLHAAYKILSKLEHKDRDLSISAQIGPAALGMEEADWLDVMHTLLDEGFIAGVEIKRDILGNTNVDMRRARITMTGAEYLHENSAMTKIAKAVSDIVTIIK